MTVQGRTIRVFVSSTFNDMYDEREELTKRVFPRLRRLCEERGASWGEVDLRWGVTEEDQAQGRLLPSIFAQIDRCECFIALLGQRYGTAADSIPQDLLEEADWLSHREERSITELEIQYAALNDPDHERCVFFYFRDPVSLENLSKSRRALFQEKSRKRAGRLERLKENIRNSPYPVRNYWDAPSLGELVLADFSDLIDHLFPSVLPPDALTRQIAEHQAFADSRRNIYIGGQKYYDALDGHVTSNEPVIKVVVGRPGCGKSALLANWGCRYEEQHSDTVVVTHFIGATPDSSDWISMLQRILKELNRRLSLQVTIPDQSKNLIPTFDKALRQAARKARLVLIMDALDQLTGATLESRLAWLPCDLPPGVRIVVSTRPGSTRKHLKSFPGSELNVTPLRKLERRSFIEAYLNKYGKSLSEQLTAQLVDAKQTRTPGYLRAVLDELRFFGRHGKDLEKRVKQYLDTTNERKLYERILARLETDYDHERPGLVKETMSLLWGSRRGLSEIELLELLGTSDRLLADAVWSPFFLAIEGFLVNRSGLLNFFHDDFRATVQNRYLTSDRKRESVHVRLARYFEELETGPRQVDELPWQLSAAKCWRKLQDLLANLKFFATAWETRPLELKQLWRLVEANSQLQPVEAYREVLREPAKHDEHLWDLAILLDDLGYHDESLTLVPLVIENLRLLAPETDLASAFEEREGTDGGYDVEAALELLKEKDRVSHELAIHSTAAREALPSSKQKDRKNALVYLDSPLSFPTDLAQVDERYRGDPNQPFIVYIQSAPVHYEAQQKIAKILETFLKEGFRLVLVEGGNIKGDLSKLRKLGSSEARHQVSEKYLKDGLLSGEEYLDLVSDYSMTRWGVEDLRLYEKCLSLHHDIGESRRRVLNTLGSFREILWSIQMKLHAPGFRQLLQNTRSMEDTEQSFSSYCEYLLTSALGRRMDMAPYSNLETLARAASIERKIDFKAVDKECEAVLDTLTGRLEEDELKPLADRLRELGDDPGRHFEYYECVSELLYKADSRPGSHRNLDRYIEYLREYRKIDQVVLFKEVAALERDLKFRLLRTKEERHVSEMYTNVLALEKLFKMQMSAEDVTRIRVRQQGCRVAQWILDLERFIKDLSVKGKMPDDAMLVDEELSRILYFYEVIEKRVHALVRNALKKIEEEGVERAVLIATGFHKDRIGKLFRERGIGYVLIRPVLTQPADLDLLWDVFEKKRSGSEPDKKKKPRRVKKFS